MKKNNEKLMPAEQQRKNAVSVLQELQQKHGYLPIIEMEKLAKNLGIPAVELFGVATFYTQFRLTKPGKYTISVCTGTACHIKNSSLLIKFAEELLGIKRGQTTSDGKISFESVNCLGACAKAPAMMINGTVFGELTKTKMKEIIEGLK